MRLFEKASPHRKVLNALPPLLDLQTNLFATTTAKLSVANRQRLLFHSCDFSLGATPTNSKQPATLACRGTSPNALLFTSLKCIVQTRYAHMAAFADSNCLIAIILTIRIKNIRVKALTRTIHAPRCIKLVHLNPLVLVATERLRLQRPTSPIRENSETSDIAIIGNIN
ncbi:unannotated protein [freshwater metagenome]|uniref:Unannotated protein n=1 Tax=freshwater metagenome TaxID=449393 RepID=A0A6J7NHR4_9ZZZZ